MCWAPRILGKGLWADVLVGTEVQCRCCAFRNLKDSTLPLAEVHRDELHCISDDFYKTGRIQVKQMQLGNTSLYQ